MRALTVAAIGAAFLAMAGGPASAKSQKVAVLGIEPQDDGQSMAKTTSLAKSLTDALRTRASRGGTYDLAPNSAKELSELKLLSDCLDENPECMSQIGKDLGADLLLFGHLEKKKDGYSISVQLLNVSSRRIEGAKVRNVPAAGADEEGMKKLAALLFSEVTGEPLETVLAVRANAQTGTVFVNDTPKGTITGGSVTLRGLPPGTVTVAVEAQGYERQEQTVELSPGETTPVKFELKPATGDIIGGGGGPVKPPTNERPGGTSRVLFWTTAVLTVGGVAAFTITGLKVKQLEDDQQKEIDAWGYDRSTATHPDDACKEARLVGTNPKLTSICDDGEQMAMLTNVFIGVSVVAAIAAGWFYYKGYIAPGEAKRESPTGTAAKRKRPRNLTVLPTLSPDGAGLTTVIQF
jgi:TolB-like protein